VADRADRLYILYQAGIGRHVRHTDEPGPQGVDQLRHRLHIHAAVAAVWRVDDLHPDARLQRQELDLVGGVIVARRQDHITAFQPRRGQRLYVGRGGVFGKGDICGFRTDQIRDGQIRRLYRILARCLCFIAADTALERDVILDRPHHRKRHQCRAGIVQMHALVAPGRIGAQALDIHAAADWLPGAGDRALERGAIPMG